MPAQTGENVRFVFEWSVSGVPTSGLIPAPLITIFSPAGVALVTAAAMTEQAAAARYIYDYVLPGTVGLYVARAFSSQANLDAQYMECAVQVGQAWIQNQKLVEAALAGKLSGATTTTVRIRDLADTKDAIVATVDADGNRSAVVTDNT